MTFNANDLYRIIELVDRALCVRVQFQSAPPLQEKDKRAFDAIDSSLCSWILERLLDRRSFQVVLLGGSFEDCHGSEGNAFSNHTNLDSMAVLTIE